ncbi:phage protein [Vibrio cholerae]|uniref:phage protein n=1 Tax=Vibrio cholerae TaxID=666 RepID=UPI000E0AE608|nr:phage protein [Vibrio cholerae]EGR4143553.1 regulator [Vibrio cholerae]MDQ4623376.1 phage protein [Vibrio cholerae]MDQ4696766.1 phage protein [Vibrio cholerae]TLE24666.1 regulator [Vibrio cholerae]TLE29446.1 regulator [Vibrio cholerae]
MNEVLRNDKKLCFKTVSKVKRWDEGEKIPPICKRLMRWHNRKELYYGDEWWGFRMEGGRLILPTGDRVAPQQILFAIAIMQIEAPEHDLARSKLLKYARAMVRIKGL